MQYEHLVVGITGGIGSGKSTFCEILEKNGYPVLNADALAKSIMAENEKVKNDIITAFGEIAYQDGKINASFLGNLVFNDYEKLKLLNSIVHPVVIKEIKNKVEKLKENNRIIFVESALIYEANFDEMFDFIILIYSSIKDRIARIAQRNNLSEEEILKRINSQIPDEEKRKYADIIIDNTDDIEFLKNRASFILVLFKSLLLPKK
ncbi:MAG TPA: dephospho-CoA kinase [Ignavibacteriales bacterium]|nr:dephospho-CoA kinase [Ignavibacteriales bacterium]HOL81587.1 dephospho-CoA kinase [Ignavibacteriales bacterium]HOM65583.1 dephospho-CoA kinase [Ignavibacteriales bacterium]HPD67854.1 dephospho-CoA kinase [Ignavibacteriales bacterium]HPP33701.1 dephospho-CoA kinase [Ignavibacteriales bacterium]